MKNINFHHTVDAGWSCAQFPKLDAPTTAVLVFGAPKHPDLADRFAELHDAARHWMHDDAGFIADPCPLATSA